MARIRIPISYENLKNITTGIGLIIGIKSAWDSITYDALSKSEAGLLMLFAGIHFLFSWLVFKDKIDISKKWSIVNIIWGITALGSLFLINI